MLQVALGGHKNFTTEEEVFFNRPTYYEPGFNFLSPLELQAPVIDRVYITVRKRIDSGGQLFEEIIPRNRLIVVSTDATTGKAIPHSVRLNADINSLWNVGPSEFPGPFEPLVVFVDPGLNQENTITRVRAIDVYIKDTLDNDFITLRLLVDDEGKFFHYIPVDRDDIGNRNEFSAVGRNVYVFIRSSTDSYVIISPYAWIKETTKEDADFSYPLDSIHYKRQKTYNEEDFNFSIKSTSRPFVTKDISLLTMPNYKKCALLLVDSHMNTKLIDIADSASVTIGIEGVLSGIEDTFIVNFLRG